MYFKKNKRILELINTTFELINIVNETGNVGLLNDGKVAIEVISTFLDKELYDIQETENQLNLVLSNFQNIIDNKDDVSYDELNNLFISVCTFEELYLKQIDVKLNIVFMPYNITMWDSLESIYHECIKDEDCVAQIVPIPFYDISGSKPVYQYHGDLYDKSLNIIDYRTFDLAEEEPDVIYINNIYDDGNILTTVDPTFYTENLKKYTDMLVYSPYAFPNYMSIYTYSTNYAFVGKGAGNVDKFICAGNFVNEEGERQGIDKSKLINLGTPKFDSLINNINKEYEYPDKIIKNSEGKRILLYSTSLDFFVKKYIENTHRLTNGIEAVARLQEMFTVCKENDIFVIWRPHPLTKNFINKSNPEIVQWYENLCKSIRDEKNLRYSNVWLDENQSYIPSFKISDAFCTNYTSIMFSYLALNKKLILDMDYKYVKSLKIDFDKNKMLFTQGRDKYYLEFLLDFEKTDEIQIDTKFLSKYYKNIDGTAGKKIHKKIKEEVLKI